MHMQFVISYLKFAASSCGASFNAAVIPYLRLGWVHFSGPAFVMTCGLCECTAAAALCSSVALESRRIPPTNLAILQQPHSMRYFDLRGACFISTLPCIIGFEIGKAEASCQFSRLSSRPTAFSHHQSMNGGANNSIWFDFCTTSSSTRPRASACILEIAKKLSSALAPLSLFCASPPPHSNYRDNRFTYDIIAVRARVQLAWERCNNHAVFF